MKHLALISSLLLMTLSVNLHAVDLSKLPKEQASRILTNTATDMASCAAFYQVVSQCLNNTESGKGVGFEKMATNSLMLSSVMLNTSNALTLGPDIEKGEQFNVLKQAERLIRMAAARLFFFGWCGICCQTRVSLETN